MRRLLRLGGGLQFASPSTRRRASRAEVSRRIAKRLSNFTPEDGTAFTWIGRSSQELQPASFASFIVQRSRWLQGIIQIFLFQRPFMKRGLTIPQRLCYMSSMLFWFFPVARTIFLIAPLFYLFFGLEIFTSSGSEFLAYTLSYMIVNLLMQNYLYGEYRWPWISELYEYAQSLYMLPALVSV